MNHFNVLFKRNKIIGKESAFKRMPDRPWVEDSRLYLNLPGIFYRLYQAPQNRPSFHLTMLYPDYPQFRLPKAYKSVLQLEEYCPVLPESQRNRLFGNSV